MIKSILNRMSSDLRFKKFIISTVLSILVLLLVFAFFYIHDYGGEVFVLDGDAFQLIKISSKQITLQNSKGDELTFAEESTITLVAKYYGHTVRFGGGHDGIIGVGYSFSDGTKMSGSSLSGLTDFQQKEVQLLNNLHNYFDGISQKYKHPFYYLFMLIGVSFSVALSIYMLVYTTEYWDNSLAKKLFVQGGGPTDFALLAIKIVGIILITASTLLFLTFIMK